MDFKYLGFFICYTYGGLSRDFPFPRAYTMYRNICIIYKAGEGFLGIKLWKNSSLHVFEGGRNVGKIPAGSWISLGKRGGEILGKGS